MKLDNLNEEIIRKFSLSGVERRYYKNGELECVDTYRNGELVT